jgi:hypothetical protein
MVGALVATPASADTPERFVGNAAARALGIKLLNTDLAFGDATSLVNSTLDPVAKAAGQILPSLVGATQATTASGVKQDGETCGLPQLPDPVGSVLDLSVACSTSVASVVDGLKSSAGVGYVSSLGIDASSLLAALPLPDLTETLDQVTAPVLEVLQPVIDAVEEATGVQIDEAVTTVGNLLEQLLSQKALQVDLGKAASKVLTLANSVTSTSSAEGATISILPVSELLGNVPLVKITVGSSSATATYDRGLGKAIPSFDASLVTIEVAALPGITPAIKQTVSPGQTIEILKGTLLQSRITVADGRSESLPDGGVKAIADGVSLELLQGLNASSPTAFDGGVALQLAHSEAAVVGAPAVKTPATPIVAGVQQLPRTGGTPWIPLAGIGVLGLFVATRRIAVRTSR